MMIRLVGRRGVPGVMAVLVLVLGMGSWTRVAGQAPPASVQAPAAVDSVALQLDRYRANPAAAPPPRLDTRGLAAFVGQLKSSAPGWIGVNGPAGEPERRLAVATYVLDLINAQDQKTWLLQPLLKASGLVDWACLILRGGPPPLAERDWYVAAAALLELVDDETRTSAGNDGRLDPLIRLLDAANERFPKDPRWQLGRAIAADLRTFPDSHTGHLARSSSSRDAGPFINDGEVSAITKAFASAAALPAASQEAELRWGYFELRLGRPTEALTHFRAVGDPADVFMRYWLYLFEGRAFEETHAPREAVAAYRQAVEAVPNAQSATVALAAALVAEHQTADAVSLVNGMLKAAVPLDPWVWYICPDCRAWPQAIANLRKAAAQ